MASGPSRWPGARCESATTGVGTPSPSQSASPAGETRSSQTVSRSAGNVRETPICQPASRVSPVGARSWGLLGGVSGGLLLGAVAAAFHRAPAPPAGARGVDEDQAAVVGCADANPRGLRRGEEVDRIAGQRRQGLAGAAGVSDAALSAPRRSASGGWAAASLIASTSDRAEKVLDVGPARAAVPTPRRGPHHRCG